MQKPQPITEPHYDWIDLQRYFESVGFPEWRPFTRGDVSNGEMISFEITDRPEDEYKGPHEVEVARLRACEKVFMEHYPECLTGSYQDEGEPRYKYGEVNIKVSW
jgi:hypothetical protein